MATARGPRVVGVQVPGHSYLHAVPERDSLGMWGEGLTGANHTRAIIASRVRAFPLAMAEAPATPAGNEPVPSSDGKQRLLFPSFLVFLCLRLAQL